MGRRLRVFAASAGREHALGPIASWPAGLRTMVATMLRSPVPMWLGWGDEHFFFCNDACLPLLGGSARRRWRPGAPAEQVWGEDWREVAPLAPPRRRRGVEARRGAVVPVARSIQLAAGEFTFSYSPIPDDAGDPAGVLCVITLAAARASAPAIAPTSARAGRARANGEEDASNTAEVQLERVLTGVNDFVAMFDREWCCVYVDERILALAGKQGVNVRGRVCWEVFPNAVGTALEREMRATMATQVPSHFEYFHVPWSRWFDYHAYPSADGLALFGTDITDHRATVAALRETEQRLRLATQTGKLGIWDWDIRTNRVTWSESLYAIHGVSRDEFDGTVENFQALVHPDDRRRVGDAIRSALEGAPYELELRTLRTDGTVAWVYASAVVVREEGRAVRMLGATMDITERRRAMDAVTESEQRFSRFMHHLPGLAWIKDDHGRYVFVNGSAARVFGLSPAELLGRTDAEIFPQEVADQFRRNDHNALESESGTQVVETLRHHEDGRLHHAIVSKFPIPAGHGRPPFIGGMAIDITDRYEAELALQGAHTRLEQRVRERTADLEQANARFQAMFDQGLFAGLIALDGTLVDINRSWLDASGFSRSEVLGRPFWETGWWGSAAELQAWIKIGFAEALQGERFHGETVYFTAGGEERRLDFALMPIRHQSGEVSFIVPSGIDITDRYRAEQGLKRAEFARESDLRFRRMADAAPVLIWIADVNNSGTWFNQQWLDFVGRPLERELDVGWLENVHADDLERCVKVSNDAFVARREFEMEFRMRRHDGEFRWVLEHGVPTFAPGGEFTGYISSCIDITERKQAEVAIHRLAAIVESSSDAILTVDLEGFITSWNRGAELLYGYTSAEIIGHSITLLIPPERVGEEVRFLARTGRGERVDHLETQRRRKDGSTVDISLSISPIRDAAGVIVGASKISRDISRLKQAAQALRESEERFRTLADNIAQFAWTAEPKGGIGWFNQRWFEYTGTTLREVEGWGWRAVHHPDHVERVIGKYLRCIANGEVWEDTFPLRRHDGEYRWFLSRAVPIRDRHDRVVRWFGTNTDITDLREVELALERARDDAIAASRAKDDFLAALSHELRTPLNPVLLLASDAADNEALPPEVRADFETIRKHASLEARLIDDLLDLSRISHGKLSLEIEEHDVHSILQDALATVRAEIEEKPVALSLEFQSGPLRVRGDAVRLQQVFWNILKNAVKFTPPHGEIVIRTRALLQTDRVEIAITDTGVGLSAAEIPRIFDAFTQGGQGSDAHRFGGLGLGLAISRKIVESHAGSITASSPGPGKGASFVITLPGVGASRTAPEPTETTGLRLENDPPHGVRILLVEDHAPTRITLERLLVRRQHRVISAGTLTEATRLMREQTFDLLISDVGLPDGSGCDLMRACARDRGCPGIALTGYGMEPDIARSRDAGFAAHLTKPVQVAALDRAIADVLSRRVPSDLRS